MKLTDEQFAELASSFGAVDSAPGQERRRTDRVDLQAQIRITPLVSGQKLTPRDVIACDFSARGLAFMADNLIPPGEQFITRLSRRSGGQVDLHCTVAHCQAVTDKLFRVGVEFTNAVPAHPGDEQPNPSEN